MNSFNIKVKNIGKRLILSLPKKVFTSLNINKGDNLKILIKKGENECILFSKYNWLISLTKQCVISLNLHPGELINVTFEKIEKNSISNSLFDNGKIDLLFLIPNKTSKGNEIVIDEFEKDSTKWLNIKSFHARGSSRQIKLRRFVDSYILGSFLGQLQSEGTKSFNERLEFCNKSLEEHLDFVNYLNYIGIPKQKILAKIDFSKNIGDIKEKISEFEKIVGIEIKYISRSSTDRNGYGFKTFVRSTIFAELILSFMDILRKEITPNTINDYLTHFSDGFVSKVLNGDGTIYLINRGKNRIVQARLSIADGNYNYLKDYKEILKRYRLKPHINRKWGFVRSYLNYETAKKLVNAGAFKNNPNHLKLLSFIHQFENLSVKNSELATLGS